MGLRIDGISKHFGELATVDGVTLEIPAGQMAGTIRMPVSWKRLKPG